MMFPSFLKLAKTGNGDSITDSCTTFTPYPYVFPWLWRRGQGSLRKFFMYFPLIVGYIWQQPVDLLIVLSVPVLSEPGWLALDVARTLSLSYLKHTRAFPAQKKAPGLTVVCWSHPCSGTQPPPATLLAHWASDLLSSLFTFKWSQVDSFPVTLLGWHCWECSSSHIKWTVLSL